MKRALLFAPYFLPRRRVGAMRPFRFAIHLRKFGWAPTVLTIRARGQHLTDKEAHLLREVEIVEIDPPFDRTVRAESQLGAPSARAASEGADGRTGTWPSWMPTVKLPGLDRLNLDRLERQFPVDTWLPLFALKYRQIAATVRRVHPHVLWSSGDPWSSLVVARHVRRRFGVPWVADFRDPWTLCDVRTEGLWPPTQAANRYLERRVLETADTVLFQAARIEKRYRRHYADLALRTSTIYNSYDPAVFDDPVALEAHVPPPAAGRTLRLAFFGRFRALSPAAPVGDLLAAVRRRHGALADRIEVHAFGPLGDDDAQYAAARGVRTCFRRQEAVPLERALAALRPFDLLLLSTDPRRDGIIPAKLLEYLAVGRPILSLSQNPEVARILRRTGTGVQLDLAATEENADLLAGCLRAKQAGRPPPLPFDPNPEAIRPFEARATTRALAALFEETRARAGHSVSD